MQYCMSRGEELGLQSGMVSANLDSEARMGPERGSETEDLYIRLLLANATRE